MIGAGYAPARESVAESVVASRCTDRVLALIRRKPGLTQDELAYELFGERSYPALVRRECRTLVADGSVVVTGFGVRGSPYVYSPLKRDD